MQRLIAHLLTVLLTVAGLTAVATATAGSANAKDVDCSDFSSQAAAQNYFLNHGGPNSDPNGLDAEGDGIACESNPCPCSSNTNGGGGGGDNGNGGANNQPKPKHQISGRTAKVGKTGRFVAVGRVVTLKNGRIQLLRKVGASSYRTYKSKVTNKQTGAFRVGVAQAGKKTCYRIVAPETKTRRKTEKDIGCIAAS